MAIISLIQFSINKTTILHHLKESSYNKYPTKELNRLIILFIFYHFFISVKIPKFSSLCILSFFLSFFLLFTLIAEMEAINFIQKLANVLFYLLFLVATIYTVVGPNPNDIVVMKGQTYITPGKKETNIKHKI
jgi:hypothetical protein